MKAGLVISITMALSFDNEPRLVRFGGSMKHLGSLAVAGIVFEGMDAREQLVSRKLTDEREGYRDGGKNKSFFIAVPTATILGGPDLYVGAGSTINLTCAIHFSSEPPAYIFWYYNENVLSYDSPRGGVSVITEKGGDVTTSWLLIQTAQPSDSGEYSCKPSNANTASIKVHVLNGECLHARLRNLTIPGDPRVVRQHPLRAFLCTAKSPVSPGIVESGKDCAYPRPYCTRNILKHARLPKE